eukprot:GHVR01107623.1.p2 GENE.GHVR01107623.1~~GHVR01107623.1.p2  ORF type:complete len:299 (+),score=29.02 GHVR01107623.1:51-947(+)
MPALTRMRHKQIEASKDYSVASGFVPSITAGLSTTEASNHNPNIRLPTGDETTTTIADCQAIINMQAATIDWIMRKVNNDEINMFQRDTAEARSKLDLNLRVNPISVIMSLGTTGKAEALATHHSVCAETARGLGVALHTALGKEERRFIKQSGDVDTQALKLAVTANEFNDVVLIPTALVAHMIYSLNALADINIAWERIFERTNLNTNVHTVLQEGIFFAQMSEEEYHTKVVNNKDKLPTQAEQRGQSGPSASRGGFGNNKGGKGNYKGFNYDPNFYKKQGNVGGARTSMRSHLGS